MSEARRVIRPLFSILLIGGTIAGLYNVFSENSDVVSMAKRTACPADDCSHQITRQARNPITQSFTVQINTQRPGSGRTIDVDCRRAYWLIGDYSCEKQND